MEMVSVKDMKEKLATFEEKSAADAQEMATIKAMCEDYKVELEAVKAELMEAKADVEGQAVAQEEAVKELKDELEEKDVALVDANESIEQMKADMAISPVAQVIEGQDLEIEDGAEAGEDVDHKAEMNKIEDSAKRIAYYRSHKEEIDKA